MSGQTCIRRPNATWTSCTCPPCRQERARTVNLYRLGRIPPTPSQEAWAVVDHLIDDLDWTRGAVASACGLPERTIAGAIERRAAGRSSRWTRPTARAILGRAKWPTQGQIGATGSTRRLRALAAIGWTVGDVAAHAGVSPMTVSVLRSGGGRTRRVNAGIAAAVRDVYDALSMTPGPSQVAASAAARDGWVPPLAWDDDEIDDPTATPCDGSSARRDPESVDEIVVQRTLAGERMDLTRAERVIVVEHLAAEGMADAAIGERVGVTARTVHRDRSENGIPSRWVA